MYTNYFLSSSVCNSYIHLLNAFRLYFWFFFWSRREYPVVLVAEQIQNKTDKQKSNKVLSLTLLQNLDDSGDNELTYLELVNIHIAPFSVSVDRALARSIITWANPILLLLDSNETEDETNGNGLDDVTDGT